MTTEAERSYRRRLLATAMRDDVQKETMQQCLELLDEEFGEVEAFKYSDVIARMEKNLAATELDANRLLGRIMVLKRKETSDLLPDPASDGSVTRSRRLKVFNALFGAMCEDASQRGKLSELQRVFAQLEGLGSECCASVGEWSKASNDWFICGADEDLQKVVNFAFVWMCNTYGPVEADKVLVRAVKSAEEIPEAFACSPRDFL